MTTPAETKSLPTRKRGLSLKHGPTGQVGLPGLLCPFCGQFVDTAPETDVGRFIKKFCDLYMEYRHGAKYVPIRTRDVPIVRQLLHEFPAARLEQITILLLTTNNAWVAGTDRSIQILREKATWADDRLRARGL
jgi:hypothetical protein